MVVWKIIKMNPDKKNLLLILTIGFLAWFPTLNFWFFKAYEATWLTGIAPYNLISLIKGHGFLYFLDWKIFGWNPWGWYLTSLVLHILASLLFYKFVLNISKKRNLAFISSIFFVASTSYNDILTWGSFNSYYPLLLICFLSCLISFSKFKETKKKYFLVISIFSAFIGFFVRETGIVIIPLVTAFDLIFSKKILSRETILGIVKRQIPYFLVIVGFFIIRSSYGGTPGDSADSNVKLQMRFVIDGLYLDYAKATLLSLGKLIPPQVLPYEIINYLREFGSKFIFYQTINTYFFPILGGLVLGFFGFCAFLLRKSKTYFNVFLFFLVWLGLFSLFVSLAVPNTPEVLSRAYEYNTMRYRYFAFLGTAVILAIILINYVKKVRILKAIVAFIVISNLILIWRTEREIYSDYYKPAKEFYLKFNSLFPVLPTKTTFYIYSHAPALGDYLLEWFIIKDKKYANLVGQPFRVESQMIAVLNKIKSGKVNIDDLVFLDYTKEKGLINETEKVRKILLNQKEYGLTVKNSKENLFNSDEFDGPPIELPYNARLNLNIGNGLGFVGSTPNSAKFRALVDYADQRNKYLKTVTVKTAYTMSQREGEPFFHVLPKNLTDGNIGLRSSWIADDWTPWVAVDLGKETQVAAVSWGSMGETRVPATYSISVSTDNKSWKKVIDVKNSNVSHKIDVLKETVSARYVKMDIKTTSGGDFVLIDEFEVITGSGKNVLSYYKDRNELFYDVVNLYKFAQTSEDLIYADKLDTYYGKLTWETNETPSAQNGQFLYFPYKVNFENQTINIEIPELEIFAGTGQFLKKKINAVSVDFMQTPYLINLDSFNLIPRMKL